MSQESNKKPSPEYQPQHTHTLKTLVKMIQNVPVKYRKPPLDVYDDSITVYNEQQPHLEIRRYQLSSIQKELSFTIPHKDLSVQLSYKKDPSALYREQDYEARKILKEAEKVFPNLPGNHVEVDNTSTMNSKPLHENFWNNWRTDKIEKAYLEGIYPYTINRFINLFYSLPKGDIAWVDLFSGDGYFIREMMSEIDLYKLQPQIDFHLFDKNQTSLESAKSRFESMRRTNESHKNVTIHERIDLTTHIQDVFKDIKKPSIVTAIGGLCHNVINKKDALTIAKTTRNALEPGGVFIVTGFSDSLLNAKDFKEIGFSVEQMSVPENIFHSDSVYPIQFYVLRKKPDHS